MQQRVPNFKTKRKENFGNMYNNVLNLKIAFL